MAAFMKTHPRFRGILQESSAPQGQYVVQVFDPDLAPHSWQSFSLQSIRLNVDAANMHDAAIITAAERQYQRVVDCNRVSDP